MPNATAPFDSASRAGSVANYLLAASTLIYAGVLVARNSSGYLVEASDAANLIVLGRSIETVDNSAGTAGAASMNVERGVFQFKNSTTNAITVAHLGQYAFVEDSTTVGNTSTNKIRAGVIVALDSGGVWVDTNGAANQPPAVADAATVATLITALKSVGIIKS